MFLIDDLLNIPIGGIKFVLNTLQKVAEEQYTDSGPVKERLLELQMELESGDISEEEYAKAEADIFLELREIERRKREMAGVPEERPFMQAGTQAGMQAGLQVDMNLGQHTPKDK